jgi:pimeloyl-ACP methyl ester carboxylesterase
VLLHGLMGCAETFAPLIEALGPDLHVIALDLPGAGGSERRGDLDASLERTAWLVGRTLDALEIQRPMLLGHSHGGAVAMHLAAQRRDALGGLILLCPAHPYFTEADGLIRFYLSAAGRLFAYTLPWFPEGMQRAGLRGMAGPDSDAIVERLQPYRSNLRTRGTISHLLRLLETWRSDMDQLRELLRQPLEAPSLLLWGDCDQAVPLHSAARLREHLLDSELITLPRIGHLPAEEAPKLVAGYVRRWISSGARVCY